MIDSICKMPYSSLLNSNLPFEGNCIEAKELMALRICHKAIHSSDYFLIAKAFHKKVNVQEGLHPRYTMCTANTSFQRYNIGI